MQNMSKIIKAFKIIGLLLLGVITSTEVNAAQNGVCADKKENGVYQHTLSTTAGCISFHFSKKTNEVWLGTTKPHSKKYIAVKISPDRSPALNGEIDHMGFFSSRPVIIDNKEYIPLIYSKRTHSGSFSGECGTGVEDFLAVISITPTGHFKTIFSQLISSCAKGLYYDSSATRKQNDPVYIQEEYIFIDWYIHPEFEKSPIGKIHMLDGQIEYIDGIRK